MSMGLLTAFVVNLVGCFTSQFPHAVGGLVMPVVPILAAYFQQLGPENCSTIMVFLPLMTILCGLLTYVMGIIGVQDIIKACPFVVFGGFIAGTGAQLLEYSLNMMYPKFTSFTRLGSDGLGAFLDGEFWLLCGPGVAAALVVFLVPRLNPSGKHTFLLPAGMLALTAAFYAGLLATGTSAEEARAQGWLFDVQAPRSLDFYKVWTKQDFAAVQWHMIFSADFLTTTMQVFLMGFLTTAKNIYGTAEFTHCAIDVDKEIRGAGIQGVCCGLAGGMPGNIVMSFSITSHGLGVRTRQFSALLAALSFVFFLVGDFAIAFLPKMVPAAMLLWLGIILVISWIWDMVGSMSATEHGIVILMIAVDIVLDPGTMIVLGLFLTLIVSVKRMMAMKFIVSEHTLLQVRSDVLRTGDQTRVLAGHANEVLILRLARGYFSFTNASSVIDIVQDTLGRAASGERAPLRVLVLDFQDVLGLDTTALNTLSELRANAERQMFLLLVSGCLPEIESEVRRFGIPTYPECVDGEETYKSLMGRAASLAGSKNWGPKLLLVSSIEEPTRCVSATTIALEFSEKLLLAAYKPAEQGAGPPAQRVTATGAQLKNPSLVEAQRTLVAEAGIQESSQALPLLVDIHCWLSGYMTTYTPQIVGMLAEAFEIKEYSSGEVIYEYTSEAFPGWELSGSGPGDHVPPLLWLLAGEVEHTWAGHLHSNFSHFRGVEDTYNLKGYQRLEKAELPAGNAHYCVGPFRTEVGFKGSMMHPGRLAAAQPSRCAVLPRSRYDQLAQRSPQALDALNTYLARKQFVITSLAKADGPRLFF